MIELSVFPSDGGSRAQKPANPESQTSESKSSFEETYAAREDRSERTASSNSPDADKSSAKSDEGRDGTDERAQSQADAGAPEPEASKASRVSGAKDASAESEATSKDARDPLGDFPDASVSVEASEDGKIARLVTTVEASDPPKNGTSEGDGAQLKPVAGHPAELKLSLMQNSGPSLVQPIDAAQEEASSIRMSLDAKDIKAHGISDTAQKPGASIGAGVSQAQFDSDSDPLIGERRRASAGSSPPNAAVVSTSTPDNQVIGEKSIPAGPQRTVIGSDPKTRIRDDQMLAAQDRAENRLEHRLSGRSEKRQGFGVTPTADGAPQNKPMTAQPAMQVSVDGPDTLIATRTEAEFSISSDTKPTPGPTLQQTLARADTPVNVSRQLAEAMQLFPDRPVEVALNPEELGRVRMSISAAETGITVSVMAERSETLDMMRRHIELLSREFQAIGYDTINFSFEHGETPNDTGADQDSERQDNLSSTDLASDETAPIIRLNSDSALDVRL